MKEKMHEIVELGTPGCDYTGGGIWVAYIPVLIDGEKAELWLGSEEEACDDPNMVAFTVYKNDRYDDEDGEYYQLMKYFDQGVYVGSRKDSPYKDLYKKLRKVLSKAIKDDAPIDSKMFDFDMGKHLSSSIRKYIISESHIKKPKGYWALFEDVKSVEQNENAITVVCKGKKKYKIEVTEI